MGLFGTARAIKQVRRFDEKFQVVWNCEYGELPSREIAEVVSDCVSDIFENGKAGATEGGRQLADDIERYAQMVEGDPMKMQLVLVPFFALLGNRHNSVTPGYEPYADSIIIAVRKYCPEILDVASKLDDI